MELFNQIYLILSLLLGISFILWGLKLFKFYIIVSGILIGIVIGAVIGGISGSDPLPVALIFGLIFGIIAWPIHKLIVYLTTGLFMALFGSILFGVMNISFDPLVSAILFFIIGIFLAVKLYESIIIVIMALGGANSIFTIILFGQFERIYKYGFGRNSSRMFNRIISIYQDYFLLFLITIILFVGFALYFQKKNGIKKDDNDKVRKEKILLRNVTYLFALLMFVGFIFLILFSRERDIAQISIIINTPTYPFSLFAWPILAVLTAKFIEFVNKNNAFNIVKGNEKLSKFIVIAIYSIIAIPLIGAFVSGFFAEFMQGSFGNNFEAQINVFFSGKLDFIIIFIKWLFIGVLLPYLFSYYANKNIFGERAV